MAQRLRPWADLVTVALLTALGIHTIRTYLGTAGWVLGAGLGRVQLGLLLLTIWGVGLLGGKASRLVGGRSPTLRLALLFGALYVAYRAVPGAYATAMIGSLMVTAWLWVLPNALRAISLQGNGHRILPGLILGVAAQVSLQVGQHGLDMPVLLGRGPALLSLGLVALLLLALRWSSAGEGTRPAAPPAGLPGWGLVAWGPYLALQMTLLANLGWLQWYSGWHLQAAAGLTLTGLALGAWLSGLPVPRAVRMAAALAAALPLAQPQWLAGNGVWLLLAVQALLPVAMTPALAPEPGRQRERIFLWLEAGSVLGLVLLLLFYLRNEWKLFWPIMAAAAALPGLLAGARGTPPGKSWQAAAAIVSLGALAVGFSLIPYSGQRQPVGPAPAELTAMSFNVKQLRNWYGFPDPESTARVIEAARPDLVGLQETGRGWDFTGAVDMVSWLRWRFPDYQVFWGKTEGDLLGNILMSRWPVRESGWELYQMLGSPLQRGFIWAQIPTERGDLLFLNTHLSAFRNEEPDRLNQVERLLQFWQGQPRFLLLGDLNSRPGSEPLRRLEQGGLLNLPGLLGQGDLPTFPAGDPRIRLDHVFGSRDLEPLLAEIPETTASDHRPLVVRVRIR